MLLKAKIIVMVILAGLMMVLVGLLTLGSQPGRLKRQRLIDYESHDDFSGGRR